MDHGRAIAPIGKSTWSLAALVRFPAGYNPGKREWLIDFGQRGTGGMHLLIQGRQIQFGNWNDRAGQIQRDLPPINESGDTAIVVTHEPGAADGFKLYWDGEFVASAAGNCNITTCDVHVGKRMWSEGDFSGQVKEVAIWLGTALQEDQVPIAQA